MLSVKKKIKREAQTAYAESTHKGDTEADWAASQTEADQAAHQTESVLKRCHTNTMTKTCIAHSRLIPQALFNGIHIAYGNAL